jgi:hypothetical protein
MRYYLIKLTPKSGVPIVYSTLASNGRNNGSALQVDLDIFQTYFHQVAQLGSVIIHGVDYKQLGQQSNLNGASISISVGMSAGLPFANPAQSGEIVNGTVFQAFGNWQGNQVALNLLVLPSTINPDENVNLSFNWIKGTTLQTAIQTTLKTAYPLMGFFGATSPNLVFTETQPAQYFTLRPFCEKMNAISKQLNPDPNYQGVSLSATVGGFNLIDGTIPPKKTINVAFTDIVGNLTWIDVATVQAKLVMRADCNIGDNIVFPTGAPVTNVATSYGQLRNLISFDGVFRINKIRHIGSSRQKDANAWVSVLDCIIIGAIPST